LILPAPGRILAALLALLPSPALADTLIDNVNGISVDRAGQVTRFAALVIDDRGRVTQVLSRFDKAPRTDYRIDGKGRTLLPGMIDAHLHVMELGLRC